MFSGLGVYPVTPVRADGEIDVQLLASAVDVALQAAPSFVTVFGSTGGYPYFSVQQRQRAVRAAREWTSGVPLIVGVGAMTTRDVVQLAAHAERVGADGLLLPVLRYVPLTDAEIVGLIDAVCAATRLPVCIYDNPGSTGTTLTVPLLADLVQRPTVQAVKVPVTDSDDGALAFASLRRTLAPVTVGFSGDWNAVRFAPIADGWHSSLAAAIPKFASAVRAGNGLGDVPRRGVADLTALARQIGSIRVAHALLSDRLGLPVPMPSPLQPVPADQLAAIRAAAASIRRGPVS